MGILLTTFATIGSLSRPLPSFDGILIFFPHPQRSLHPQQQYFFWRIAFLSLAHAL
jgi:hypothetical protein